MHLCNDITELVVAIFSITLLRERVLIRSSRAVTIPSTAGETTQEQWTEKHWHYSLLTTLRITHQLIKEPEGSALTPNYPL